MKPTLLLNARELKAQADLVKIASEYTRLRRSGRQLTGLCPLHRERHPSFFVHPEKQIFKCFGCGAGGDIFTFLMLAVGCDFRRALEIVNESMGGSPRERAAKRRAVSSGRRGLPPVSREARHSHSQFTRNLQQDRVRILASMEATDRRLSAIEATNRKDSAALATACEPERTGKSLYLRN